MKRRTITTVVIASVLGVAIIGGGTWVVVNTMDTSFRIAAAPTAVPTSSAPADEDAARKAAAEKAIAGKHLGDELQKQQADAVKAYFEGDAWAYTTMDGHTLLVSRSQPLPENVSADAGRKMTAAAHASADRGDTVNAAVEQKAKQLTYETGRNVVVVVKVYTWLGAAAESKGWTWMTTAGQGQQYDTADAAVAASRAAKPDVEIIVSQ